MTPLLNWFQLPEGDRAMGEALSMCVADIVGFADAFAAGSELIAYTEQEKGKLTPREQHDQRTRWNDWKRIAAQQSAMAAHDFTAAVQYFRRNVGRIPAWSDAVDSEALKQAEIEAHQLFPDIRFVRDSVAHPELYSRPNEVHGVNSEADDSGGTITIRGDLVGSALVCTFKGKQVTVNLSHQTASTITEISHKVVAAVAKIDENQR